jgi:SMC interacting uncharacterized protein involved in chromosome segregation
LRDERTLADLKVELHKTLLVAEYERSKAREWHNVVKRQAVHIDEKDARIKSLENVQANFERQIRKAAVQLDKSRQAYSIQCDETSRWKQHVLDLKSQISSQSREMASIIEDQRRLDQMQEVINRSIAVDPTENLMSLFNAVSNEYEASV